MSDERKPEYLACPEVGGGECAAVQALAISGMYRTGSTLAWRVFAADPRFDRYFCEPLHPLLPENVLKYGHYAIYGRTPGLISNWSPDFHSTGHFIERGAEWPELRRYLGQILGPGDLVKFTRMCTRLGWLADAFPNIKIVNLVRDPRAVCFSYLKGRRLASVDRILKKYLKLSLELAPKRVFSKGARLIHRSADYYEWYQQSSKWYGYLSKFENHRPHIKVLALWRVNTEQSLIDLEGMQPERHATLKYEDLILTPKSTLNALYHRLWGIECPNAVLDEVNGATVKDLGGHRDWQAPIRLGDPQRHLRAWTRIDQRKWAEAVKVTELTPLLGRLGYER